MAGRSIGPVDDDRRAPLYDWGSTMCSRPTRSTAPRSRPAPPWKAPTPRIARGIPPLSANGDTPGSGVLWANTPGTNRWIPVLVPTLHAFNAENITQELWNSQINAARDDRRLREQHAADGRERQGLSGEWSFQVLVYGLFTAYSAALTSLPFGTQAENTSSARHR